jgi:hypothetical protein
MRRINKKLAPVVETGASPASGYLGGGGRNAITSLC